MLDKLIQEDFGLEEDFNCAEKILYGANQAYQLEIEDKSLKLCAAFGGGMGTGSTCGAVASALMVIGYLKTEKVAHQSPQVKAMAIEFQEKYIEAMGSISCHALKDQHFDDQVGCKHVILAAAKLLDEMVEA